jgi:hypothetical protein
MRPRQYPRALLLALLTACLLHSLPARADSDAASRALAVQLFDEAETLLGRGEVAQACPKYAESYRLDPQLGALIYLAECYEKNGQLASAWGSFREAEEMARKYGDPRAEHARERAAALEPELSYLMIEIPSNARVAGLQVLRDGLPVNEVLWGARAAVDPGSHHVEARAAGHVPWQQSVDVAKGPGALKITVPLLRPDRSTVAANSTVAAKKTASGNGQKIAALAVGGLGVVGVGVGGFFSLSAQSTLSDSQGECNANDYCTPHGIELRSSAKTKALVATVSTAVGAAALVTAGVLWFTAPKVENDGVARRMPARRVAWTVGPTRDGWGVEVNHAF